MLLVGKEDVQHLLSTAGKFTQLVLTVALNVILKGGLVTVVFYGYHLNSWVIR